MDYAEREQPRPKVKFALMFAIFADGNMADKEGLAIPHKPFV